jgi:hypothetical protein
MKFDYTLNWLGKQQLPTTTNPEVDLPEFSHHFL